ncbi:unnamed protein product [Phytophthora lilii]|uniref:Unnamed protein product n=1 Tax=Phytophthora lilii TaxID=2077276 RepID=A0A9W6TVL8_9STRA|nr:unnamed protein product [Phytophthora lilii]
MAFPAGRSLKTTMYPSCQQAASLNLREPSSSPGTPTMTNAASRQKANNANSNSKSGKNTATAPVKQTNTKASASQSAKVTTTIAAAPVSAASKNASKNAQASNKAANAANGSKPDKNTKQFALSDVNPWSVQRARQIRKSDFERFVKLHNFFTANDDAIAKPINAKANSKRDQVDQWLRNSVNPKVLASIQEVQETQQALLSLLIVSAAISKYGEQELVRRNSLGEMDNIIGARFGTSGLRSKQQMPHTVGASYVLRLVLGLAPEKRAACQTLRDILNHESNARLVLQPTSKGLKPAFGTVGADSDDWAKLNQYQLKHMAKQAQSGKFQDAMQQLGGEHLYDAIRTQVKQAGGASFWDASNDKPALRQKNIRPRSASADKGPQPKKEGPKQQSGKKNANQNAKKQLPVETEKWTQVPPPAPVSVKPVTNAQIKKATGQEKSQVKNSYPVKNVSPVKNATPVKNVVAVGAWAGPLPASILQSRPIAIVSSAPTLSARVGNRGRAILSRAL